MSEAALEQVKQLAAQLSRSERAHLARWLGTTWDSDPVTSGDTAPRRSLYGLCADLGPAPSDADIEAVRQEMWATFPREDIA